MRGLLIAVAIILVLILVGWITVANTGDRAGLIIEKDKIREDTRQLSEGAREFVRNADDRVRNTVEPKDQPESSPQ